MCGRESNYDRNAEKMCRMGYNARNFGANNHYVTTFTKSGAGKYKFKPNQTGKRFKLPELIVSKFEVDDKIGPFYKFDFRQNYLGLVVWARQV